MVSTLAFEMSQLWVGISVTGFFLVCLMLILTILIQRPQGGGLAGAFGSGAGSGQTAFGAKTGDALTWFTIGTFVVYIAAAIWMNFLLRPATAVEVLPTATTTGTAPAETAPSTPFPAESAPTATPAVPIVPAPAATEPTTAPAPTPAPASEIPAATPDPAATPATEPAQP